MNTQNPTFPFYGKTVTSGIFKFDSEHNGICVKESNVWDIGETWDHECPSCFEKSYITPLTEQEIKDNNLPELKQMNTTINPVTGLAVTFPLRAQYKYLNLIVEFTSEFEGIVISGGSHQPGHHSKTWLKGCLNPDFWTILAVEPASDENKPENNKQMNNTPFVLPEKWFIRTLNPIFSAEIQKQFFKLGWKWLSDDEIVKYENDPILKQAYTPSRFVRVNNHEIRTIADYTEITIEQLFSLSPAPKEIEFEIAGYKGAATAETIKVGCQEMTMANYKEMRKEIEEYRKPKPYKHLHNKFKDSKTSITISSQGIDFSSTEFGICHLQYKEFDELDKTLNTLNK